MSIRGKWWAMHCYSQSLSSLNKQEFNRHNRHPRTPAERGSKREREDTLCRLLLQCDCEGRTHPHTKEPSSITPAAAAAASDQLAGGLMLTRTAVYGYRPCVGWKGSLVYVCRDRSKRERERVHVAAEEEKRVPLSRTFWWGAHSNICELLPSYTCYPISSSTNTHTHTTEEEKAAAAKKTLIQWFIAFVHRERVSNLSLSLSMLSMLFSWVLLHFR